MSGIFGLSAYNDQNLAGLIADKTRESFREYGYFGGGTNPGPLSTVDHIDYSNDTATASIRGLLSLARGSLAATGNSNFGYFGGGIIPGVVSTVDRIDYSNDSATASPRGSLSRNIHRSSAAGNTNFGWFTGGHTDVNITDINFSISTIDRIDYSNDLSTASIRGNLNQNRTNHSITGNSNYGWIAGGNRATNDPAYFTSVERLDYSNDVSLTSFRSTSNDISGQGNSATGNNNFGYHHRGTNPSGQSRTNVNRIDYSNDLVSPTLRGPLSLFIAGRAASGNSNFGYFGGGLLIPAGFTPNSSVERIDYSNDTVNATVRGPLSLERRALAATSSHSFGGSPISQYGVFPKPFGYFGGGSGSTPGGSTLINRLDYSNDTQNSISKSSLNDARWGLSATGNSNFGYFCGGSSTPGLTEYSTVDRIDYSNDQNNTLRRGSLNISKRYTSSLSTSSFGFISGGLTTGPTNYSSTERIDYSNDNVLPLIRGPLSTSKSFLAATGNYNFGYFGGGTLFPAPIYSTIERINYSNDTQTSTNRSLLLTAKRSLAATGNNSFGYYAGGYLSPGETSKVERLDYSNDTTNATERTNLSITRFALSATGNSNFGYFSGGTTSSPGYFSVVDRVDYSNDTATASIRGSLIDNSGYNSGISPLTPSSAFSPDQLPLGFSNTDFQPTSTFFDIQSMRRIEDTTNESVKKRVLGSYGYFGGGSSILSRIDFSNDLATSSSRSVVVITSDEQYAGTGNNNFGYFGGGYISTPSPGGTSTVGRVDYSNDNAICSIRGPLTTSLRLQSASGTNNFGYFAGGISTDSAKSIITRIDYSNDLLTSQNRSNMKFSKTVMGFTSNSNFGYLAAGFLFPSTAYSNVERINYSNDNISPTTRGNLSSNKNSQFSFCFGSTGNENFGYFGGGTNPEPLSTVDRIDYSNDTATASVRGPLSLARYSLAATGNSNFGYFGGGDDGPFSTVDRIDYSNDTATASVRDPLSLERESYCATTNARNS